MPPAVVFLKPFTGVWMFQESRRFFPFVPWPVLTAMRTGRGGEGGWRGGGEEDGLIHPRLHSFIAEPHGTDDFPLRHRDNSIDQVADNGPRVVAKAPWHGTAC